MGTIWGQFLGGTPALPEPLDPDAPTLGTLGDVIDDATIAEAGRRISAAAPSARVILFGSHARGDAGSWSDLDFLVIEPEVADPGDEAVRLRRTLRGLGVPADVIVVDEAFARRRAAVAGTMVERALREGRVLADA